VIVPTKHEAFTVDKGLRGEKISTTILGPNERDKPDSTSVRVATMHRAKGLEFDEVVLLIPRKASDLKPSADTIQRLKYVAITRAKRFATVLQY
jgi:DNA helicase IV